MKFIFTILLILTLVSFESVVAQDTTVISTTLLIKYSEAISSKTIQIKRKLDSKSEKVLSRFRKKENNIAGKLAKIDSLKAAFVFDDTNNQYNQLGQRLQKNSPAVYISSLDTFSSSLKYLEQNLQLFPNTKQPDQKIKDALEKVKGLESQIQKAEIIKKFLKDRKQYLSDQLNQLGFARQIKQFNKQVYYFNQQINEYKKLLKDNKQIQKKVIDLLSQSRAFKDFFRKNSQLASLFRLPGDPNDPVTEMNLTGLQTRAQINSLIQQQITTGGPDAEVQLQQNMQIAQTKLHQLRNKLMKKGQSNSEDEMPEGYKPNNQKTKNIFERLEVGTNLQSQKANGLFPVTSDIGLSLGFKLNDKSILGVGASYKMGWGQNIRNINITHQGIGLKSFLDWKIKGSFWLSGGYEMNYRNEFNRIEALKELNAWQQSGLIGTSKVISLKTKFFKKMKIQLLWDFMSYQQIPKTEPLLFRINYLIK